MVWNYIPSWCGTKKVVSAVKCDEAEAEDGVQM